MPEDSRNNLPEGYILVEGSYPSIEDYLHLRVVNGLTPKNREQAAGAFKGGWYGAFIVHESEPTRAVAMGRVVGDGGWYFLIADMATLPSHQRKGLGDVILKHLLATIEARAPVGKLFVNLVADPPGKRLYLKNGFEEFPAGQHSGMGKLIEVRGREA
ncbi:hypothetical protein F5Y17DRAFT_469618 [Xylariaceae sp. FL0594]|nr:hypothetical protein F5Y17DRAFT_469618 [Xylariaceae sp. FL0594]